MYNQYVQPNQGHGMLEAWAADTRQGSPYVFSLPAPTPILKFTRGNMSEWSTHPDAGCRRSQGPDPEEEDKLASSDI